MVEAGFWAYPVITASIIVLARLGHHETWGSFEWMRLGVVGILMGAATAVQVKLVMLGVSASPLAVAAGILSVAGMGALSALYIWRQWSKRSRALHASDAIPGDGLRAG